MVWTDPTTRTVRQPRFDHFIIEPEDGVIDPLNDIFAQLDGGVVAGRPHVPQLLNAKPVTVDLLMNEWLSIRRPGHYRLTAETTRVVSAANEATSVPLRSNTIEIDVVNPEPGWATAQLREAVSVLERGDLPQPGIGQPFDPRQYQARDEEAIKAAQALRFLETPDAARALARFFEHGPQRAQQELNAGLFASPYRKVVMAAMEESINSPDTPVTYYYLATVMELAQLVRIGPTPLYTAKTPEEIKRWIDDVEEPRRAATKPIEDEYFAKLAISIMGKRGQALSVSLDTLFSRGPQPASPATIKALIENFASLPDIYQQRLLTEDWPKLASPSIEPFLIGIAKGHTQTADTALRRLLDLDLDAGREIVIERIRSGDLDLGGAFSSHKSLMMLPDKMLPELDDILVTALKQGKWGQPLIARYASQSALEEIRSWFSANRGCNWDILAYLFRFDPMYAASQLSSLRQSDYSACSFSLSDPYLLMSPGLERQAIEDLSSPNPMIVRSAQALLEKGGSSRAKEPLLEAMLRFHERPRVDHFDSGMEYGFATALLQGNGWVASSADINQVYAACSSDDCRKQVASVRRMLVPPLAISFDLIIVDLYYARVGPFTVGSPQQLENKIAQFPKGTQFYLARYYEGTWFRGRCKQYIQRMLTALGMQLVEAPPSPGISATSR
jgi:hypothetical protein